MEHCCLLSGKSHATSLKFVSILRFEQYAAVLSVTMTISQQLKQEMQIKEDISEKKIFSRQTAKWSKKLNTSLKISRNYQEIHGIINESLAQQKSMIQK